MRILDRSVYVGPSLYAHFPVIRLELDLGRARGVADRAPRRDVRRRARSPHCRAWPNTAARIASPAASSAACARTRAPGSATCSSTWRSSCRTSPARKSPSARRAARGDARASTRWSTSTSSATRASPPASSALRLLCSLLPAELRRAARVPEDWSWPRGARRVHPLRAAPRARALDRLAGARRRGARHPVAAPQRPVAGPARPRQVPAAHPGDGHRTHAAHRRRARQRQGGDQQDPRRPGPAGAASRSWCRARHRRCAPRGASASRWSPSPTTATTAAASPSASTSDAEVAHGFTVAREHSRSVIVETFLEGDDHRLLVVNGELVAATRRTPGHVVGDGEHTVAAARSRS